MPIDLDLDNEAAAERAPHPDDDDAGHDVASTFFIHAGSAPQAIAPASVNSAEPPVRLDL